MGTTQGGAPPSYKWVIYKPMKTSSIYHQQKPTRDIGLINPPTNRDSELGHHLAGRW